MPIPDDWTVNVAIWAGIAAALVLLQAVGMRKAEAPAFGDVVRTARRFWILRWILVLFWLWLGWHLFVQTTLDE